MIYVILYHPIDIRCIANICINFVSILQLLCMSINITIRKRAKKGNKSSLFLDFYPAVILPGTKKATRRKGLNLFLYNNPKTTEEKDHNKNAMNIADQWRAKFLRIVEEKVFFSDLDREMYEKKEKEKQSFKKFYLEQLEKKTNLKTKSQWKSTFTYINLYCPTDFSFADITVEFLEGFKLFLLHYKDKSGKTIHQNTAVTYFKPFKAALTLAFRYEYMSKDVNKQVPQIRTLETTRAFLTLEECTWLKSTPCNDDDLRRAAFTSIYSGLRISDIKSLTWKDIVEEPDGISIVLRQQKTKNYVRIPLAENGVEYLGTRKPDSELVFPTLEKKQKYNKILREWVKKAGINKDITFHCLRHTNATLLIYVGADLFTVSKILGHSSIRVTQIYAKVMDESKRKAVNLIPI